ncbi:FAD-dependent oxidoreductase [Candidatus Pacearchaeota archaeon]|nr:FAD-dependent oxidoreductase [Candidatus Pacearchaeota archaeon]
MVKIEEYESKVLQIKEINQDIRNFILESPKNFSFAPGQFISILIPSNGNRIKRSYSLCSSKLNNKNIDLCINKVDGGMATSYLFNIKEGDYISFIGPMGAFKLAAKSMQKDILFVSTGTGIAPFTCMIPYALERNNNKITLFAGYKTENVVLYDNFFRDLLQKFENFKYKRIISLPKNVKYKGDKGYVQDLINKYLKNDFEGDIYVCGLPEMVEDVYSLLKNKGISKDRIYSEKY